MLRRWTNQLMEDSWLRCSWNLLLSGDKGDSIQASYVHHLDQSKKTSAVGEICRKFSTNENTFTVGGSYAIDHLTIVKGKLNNHGKLGGVLQHEVIPKSMFTISGEIDTKALEKAPKFGLSIALVPWCLSAICWWGFFKPFLRLFFPVLGNEHLINGTPNSLPLLGRIVFALCALWWNFCTWRHSLGIWVVLVRIRLIDKLWFRSLNQVIQNHL